MGELVPVIKFKVISPDNAGTLFLNPTIVGHLERIVKYCNRQKIVSVVADVCDFVLPSPTPFTEWSAELRKNRDDDWEVRFKTREYWCGFWWTESGLVKKLTIDHVGSYEKS